MKSKITLLIIGLWISVGNIIPLFAHPMPNSMIMLNIHENYISGELLLPLAELQSAIGMRVNDDSEKLVERLGDSLRTYLYTHIHPRTFDGKPWTLKLNTLKVIASQDPLVGEYKELAVTFEMTPPPHYDLRNFYFDYGVILRQVASHRALIRVKQDWAQGFVREDTTTMQVGVIEWDVVNGKLSPYQVSLQQGSLWIGFKNMVLLGISHIKEGTDHILFVLTLLLAAINPPNRHKKQHYFTASGMKELVRIITAFTIGHSLTLLLGAVQWLHFPSRPIEILIAITILVSSLHALRPIYPKWEVLIAGAFGLIHGLAFAETLTTLSLSTRQLLLSILGFNIGIELMQLVVIGLVFPFLLLLSQTPYYKTVRRVGAVMMMILALAWMIERIQEKPNFITEWIA